MKSCFFNGHREAGGDVFPALSEAVEHHITEHGVTDFYVGHYGGFDGLAAQAVKEARERHPEIRLTLVLPYHPGHPTDQYTKRLRWYILSLGGRTHPKAAGYYQDQSAHGGHLRLSDNLRLSLPWWHRPDSRICPEAGETRTDSC